MPSVPTASDEFGQWVLSLRCVWFGSHLDLKGELWEQSHQYPWLHWFSNEPQACNVFGLVLTLASRGSYGNSLTSTHDYIGLANEPRACNVFGLVLTLASRGSYGNSLTSTHDYIGLANEPRACNVFGLVLTLTSRGSYGNSLTSTHDYIGLAMSPRLAMCLV